MKSLFAEKFYTGESAENTKPKIIGRPKIRGMP